MSDTTTEIALRPSMGVSQALGVEEIIAQVKLVQDVMHKVMRENEHFGVVPGCGNKKCLLQPGAQKLTMTFRLSPSYEIQETNLERGHKEYRVICTLKSMGSGNFVGQGVGCCSTMEAKYRWRSGEGTPTGRPVPKEYWNNRDQSLLGGKGFVPQKIDNQWVICEKGEKVENDNPADCFNTVLKMAKKRAFVDATITATAASDIFTQDIGDDTEPQDDLDEGSDAPTAKTPLRPSQASAKGNPVSVHPATPKHLERMLARLQAKFGEAELLDYADKKAILLETEAIRDWPLSKVPTTVEAMEALEKDIASFLGGEGTPPIDRGTATPDAGHSASGTSAEEWETFPMPFGKHAGTPLRKLEKPYLFGLWANYEVETEYNGRPKNPETIKRDEKFREMLDLCGEHYEFTNKD